MLSPAIPLSLVIVPAYIIACKSEERIFEQHPSLYIIAFGLVVAKVTNRLVVTVSFAFAITVLLPLRHIFFLIAGRAHDAQ